MVRALASHARGRRFESYCLYQKNPSAQLVDFFYPSRKAWHIIGSGTLTYIITAKPCILCGLMICNFCEIDDMQCYALMICKAFALMMALF